VRLTIWTQHWLELAGYQPAAVRDLCRTLQLHLERPCPLEAPLTDVQVPFEFLELIIINGFGGRRQLLAIALKFRIDRMLMEDFFAI
jgi:hypothetical protein